MNRTEYNRIRYDFIRKQHNILETFKKENPVKYAELITKAQDEIKKEEATPYLALTSSSSSTHVQNTQNNTNRLEKLLRDFAGTRKDYFIYTEVPHNGWTEEHKYFEMLYNPTDVDEVIEKLKVRWNITLEPENIKRVEKCSCPACV